MKQIIINFINWKCKLNVKFIFFIICFFLFICEISFAQIKNCDITWYKNGVKQTIPDYITAGQFFTLERDPGTAVNISVWPTSAVSSSREYILVDQDNGIVESSGSTTKGYWYFENKIGSAATIVWLYVNNASLGRITININNYVPPKPDLTVTSFTFDNSTQLGNYKTGETVAISCRVDNNGSGVAANNYLGIYLGNSSTDYTNRIASKSVIQLSGLKATYIDHSYTFKETDAGTKYFLFKADYQNTVTENDENNNTAYRGSFQVTISPPSAPSNLICTAISASQINLTWTDNSANETEFKIERKTGESGIWSLIGTVTANTTTFNNTDLAPGTTYYYRVFAHNSGGNSGYSNEANATTISVFGNLALTILNVPNGSSLLPGTEGRVRLFNSSGTQIGDELHTDVDGKVTFSNVPVGTDYYYEVYHDPINPTTPFGREYWGKRTGLEITSKGVIESFTRNQPYIWDLRILNGTTDVTGQTIAPNTPLTVEYNLYNPASIPQSAKARILIDRDKSDPIDIPLEGTPLPQVPQSIPANGSIKQTITFTPTITGSYYMSSGVDISSTSTPNYTDGGKWSDNTVLIISPSGTKETVLFNSKDGGSGLIPLNYSGYPGTLVRLSAQLFWKILGLPLQVVNDRKITFEIKLNNEWIPIEEDGITTTNQITSYGISENYYIIPDDLAPDDYQIRAVFIGDNEYSACSKSGLLTVKQIVNEITLVNPNINSGKGIPVILVHGNKNDKSKQLNSRWDQFITFINDPKNTELFKEFDIYNWQHITEIPIGFNGSTGNAKQLADFINTFTSQGKKVILVAHSQGGLICRSYMNYENHGDNVLGLITLGTPHHGSPGVPDWSAIMWARKVGTGALSGGNFFNDLLISQGRKGSFSSLHDISVYSYDRIGDLNLVWDNEDDAIYFNKSEKFSIASFSNSEGTVELSVNDLNNKENISVSDRTILYPQILKTKFGCLKELNDKEKYKEKIITYGCYDDNLNDNKNFGEVLSLFSLSNEHDQLKVSTKFLSEFGEIATSGINFFANDGLVPLQSALFLDISGRTTFFGNNSGAIYYNNNIELKKQVKLQRIFSGTADGINDHLDLLDAPLTGLTLNYWNTLANDIRSFLPLKDLELPKVIYNSLASSWLNSNKEIDIDFNDNQALNNIWYHIDSNSNSNESNWHNLTSDGITVLPGSLNNTGTSLTTDWEIRDADWESLSNGMHSLYFKVSDDAGNVFITPDPASALQFGKDNVKPVIDFVTPTENQVFNVANVDVSWSASDVVGGLLLSGIDKNYFVLDKNTFTEVDANVLSHSFTGLSNGDHIVYLKTKDKAGNESNLKELHFSVHVPAVLERTSGNNLNGIIGTVLSKPFVATVKDADGNGVKGIPVSFDISGFPTGATGQVITNPNTTTDINGKAKCTLTLGKLIGEYRVTATSSGLSGSPVTFKATATVTETKILATNPDLTMDFGSVALNSSLDKIIEIQNNGSATFTVNKISIGGTEQFSITSPSTASFDIPAGETVPVNIRFEPFSQGMKNGTLTITNNSDNAPSKVITLTGAGVLPTKTLLITPEKSFNFGNVTMDDQKDKIFMLQNTGTTDISVTGLTLSGTNTDQYAIISPANASFTIAASATVDVKVRFLPTSTGLKSASLAIDNNSDNASPSKIINLTGTGILPVVIPTNGLVAYYPFNGNTDDESGNGNNGIIYGGVTKTIDRHGNADKAMQFNGSDGYIQVPNSSSLQSPENAMSITGWIWIDGYNGIKAAGIVNKTNTSSYGQYGLSYHEWSNPHINFNLNKESIGCFTSISLALSKWYFIAATYDGSSIVIYVNGVKINTQASTGLIIKDNNPLTIGLESPGDMEYLKGKLDDIRIYNIALTEQQIQALNNETTTNSTAPTVGIITQPTCALATGSVELNGLPEGTWTLNPGGITGSTVSKTITGLVPGTYNFTVTNTAGDISAASANVVIKAQPPTPAAPTASATLQPTCTVSTGTITVTAPTGSGMTYSIDGLAYTNTTGVFSLVSAGIYTVTAKNAEGCISAGTSVTIKAQPPTPAVPTASATLQPTCAVSTGTITVTAPTGSGMTYSLDGLAYTNTTGIFTQVPAGIYSITAKNIDGCISAGTSVTIKAQPPTPAAPTANATLQPTCTVSTGTITVTAPTGSGMTYSIDGSAYTNTTGIFPLLPAGIYTVTVKNADGCISAGTSVTIKTQPPTPAVPTASATLQPTCAVSTGTITVTAPTGSGMTYSIDGSTYTNTTGIFPLLPAGIYTVTIKNADGCISAGTSITIKAQPPTPAAPTSSATLQPTCAVSTGTITVTAPTGPGMTYSRDGLDYTNTTGIFTLVPAGICTVTAKNADGCISAETSVTIKAQPPTPAAPTANATLQPTCTVSTGTITVTAPTGSGMTYSIDGSAYTNTTGIFPLLPAGIYTVTVKNADGCISAGTSITIKAQPQTPAAPTASATLQPTCAVSTGTITVTAPSVPGMTYSIDGSAYTNTTGVFTLVPAGIYTVTAKNADGCISAGTSVTINPQPITPIAPTFGLITQPTCALATGSVELTGLPATGTWTLTRTGGAFTTGAGVSTTISGLAAGSYSYSVTNVSGCTSLASVNFIINTQPQTPIAPNASATLQPTCAISTGTITITAPTGSGMTYSINSSAYINTIGVFSLVPAGIYTVTAKNADGCISAGISVTINAQPITPSAPSLGTITQPAKSITTGSAVLNGLPATGNWILTTSPGGTTAQGTGTSKLISGLAAGTYSYTVTNASGCTSASSANVVMYVQPAAPTGLTTSSCNDLVMLKWRKNTDPNFSVYRIYGGTIGSPTTKIDSVTSTISDTTKVFSGLTRGQLYYYRVTMVNTGGAESNFSTQSSTTVKTGVIPRINSKWGVVLICYNLGDSITNFQWFRGSSLIPGAISQYFSTNKQPGTYRVETIDKDGCKNSSNAIPLSGTKSLSVYPNPASVSFTLRISGAYEESAIVSIINSAGIKVMEFEAKNNKDELLKIIPVNNLADGVYVIKVLLNQNDLYTTKIVVLK